MHHTDMWGLFARQQRAVCFLFNGNAFRNKKICDGELKTQKRGGWLRKIILKNRREKPPFLFYVKINTANQDYYAFDDFEDAMNKARVLSIAEYPIVVVLEPIQNNDGEWVMKRIFLYMQGECRENVEILLHCKFYTDAGNCLN